MASLPNPGDGVAPPELAPNNTTIIDDGSPIVSSVTTPSALPSTDILDFISSSPASEVPPEETTPVEASPVEAPVVEAPSAESPVEVPPLETSAEDAPSLETPGLDAPPEEAPPVATSPLGAPIESPVESPSPPPEDDTGAETSLDPTSTAGETPATSDFSSTTEATSLPTQVVPLRSEEEEERNNDDERVEESSQPAPSPIFETLPPAVEASPTQPQPEEATPTDEPVQTTAATGDGESPEATPPAETSAPSVDVPDRTSDNNSPASDAEDDERSDSGRLPNVEVVEQDQIVAGPDESRDGGGGSGDPEGADDNNENGGGFVGVVPGPTTTGILADPPATTTLPSGAGGDLPRGGLPDTGRTDMSRDGDQTAPAVIAGSVVGGVVGLALILGLLFWFLKRRADNRHKYVIKTPTFPPPKTSSSEKTWEFDTGSVGPTARSARLAEALGNHWLVITKIFKPAASSSARSIPRGSGANINSEFMEDTLPAPAHSRHNSVKLEPRNLERPEHKSLFTGWWSRSKHDVALNDPPRRSTDASRFATRGNIPQRRSSEVIMGYGARRPLDPRSSKASSEDFAGVLGLMLNKVNADDVSDPFSDNNEVRQNSAQARLSTANPFADSYAVNNQYPILHDDPRAHRPRGSTTGSISTPPPPFSRPGTLALDARSNCRSDQFDLEIDGQNASISLSNNGYEDIPRRPASVARIHGRDSYTSRVVSSASLGSNLDGWGEPGPDVGPGSISHTQQQGRNPERLPYIGEAM